MSTTPAGTGRRTITQLLRATLKQEREDAIALGVLLEHLKSRAFGVLLLILAIPNFIPAPIGIGAAMGILTALLGLQLVFGLERPWLPQWLQRKTLSRARVERFLDRSEKVTRRLEHLCRPRLDFISRWPWSLVSGLAMIALGTLLALPIPFTNYPFGVLLLAFAFGMIEHDGALQIIMWCIAATLLVLAIMFSSTLVHVIQQVFAHWL